MKTAAETTAPAEESCRSKDRRFTVLGTESRKCRKQKRNREPKVQKTEAEQRAESAENRSAESRKCRKQKQHREKISTGTFAQAMPNVPVRHPDTGPSISGRPGLSDVKDGYPAIHFIPFF